MALVVVVGARHRAPLAPALAPSALAQLGLLGLLYTYRHPALRRRHPDAALDRPR